MAGGIPRRITNGQRAAVCALRLAGVDMVTCCRIVDASYRQMREYLTADWYKQQRPVPAWRGQVLADLEAAYRNKSTSLATIARRFGTKPDMLRKLAHAHGWPRRRPGPVPPKLPPMTRSQRWKYELVRECTGDRQAAIDAVLGRTAGARTMHQPVRDISVERRAE